MSWTCFLFFHNCIVYFFIYHPVPPEQSYGVFSLFQPEFEENLTHPPILALFSPKMITCTTQGAKHQKTREWVTKETIIILLFQKHFCILVIQRK